MKLAFVAARLALLASCAMPLAVTPAAAQAPSADACLLPSQQKMLVAELFFGRTIKGREPLTDAEWAKFAADTITPNFPDGFTVFDGDGQWQNPQTGSIGRERTKILLVAVKPGPGLTDRLNAVIAAYKSQFHQQSIGIITRESCAAF